MKKKIVFGLGIVAVSCVAMLGGIFSGDLKTNAIASGQGLTRTPILGFNAVQGDIFLEMHRDELTTFCPKGSQGILLAHLTLTNNGGTDVEINTPHFYAIANRTFSLGENVLNVRIRATTNGGDSVERDAYIIGRRIYSDSSFVVPAYGKTELAVLADISRSAAVDFLSVEPDFTSPDFVINYVDNMGNGLALAPFNLTGDVYDVKISGTAGGTNTFTADDVHYANYYWSVKGTLTSPYIPEGAIIRNKAGIDVYIVKYNNDKRFARLILSPSVFRSYGHLKWENILEVNDMVTNSYVTSNYVRVAGDSRIWRLEPQGDTGIKREFNGYGNSAWAFDSDGVYEINTTDRDSYITGAKING